MGYARERDGSLTKGGEGEAKAILIYCRGDHKLEPVRCPFLILTGFQLGCVINQISEVTPSPPRSLSRTPETRTQENGMIYTEPGALLGCQRGGVFCRKLRVGSTSNKRDQGRDHALTTTLTPRRVQFAVCASSSTATSRRSHVSV